VGVRADGARLAFFLVRFSTRAAREENGAETTNIAPESALFFLSYSESLKQNNDIQTRSRARMTRRAATRSNVSAPAQGFGEQL
jgi:hypothetical protein